MRRLRFVLISALWIGAVTWYWRENVPLVPTKTVDIPTDRLTPTMSPASELILFTHRSAVGNPSRHIKCGPLEFWEFPACRKARELFTADDEIIAGPLYKTREVMVRRQGRLEIYQLETGALLTALPDVPGARGFRVLHDRDQIIVQGSTDLLLFDFDSTVPRWTASNLMMEGWIVGDILIASTVLSRGSVTMTRGATAVSIETGLPDTRFDHISAIAEIKLASDGRHAAVRTQGGGRSIYDLATGRLLWTIPPAVSGHYGSFSRDGAEYYANTVHPNSPGTFDRWRAADGLPLPAATAAERRAQGWDVTEDGRYAVVQANRSPPPTVDRALNQLPGRWRNLLHGVLHQNRHKVIEQDTERLVGYFPDYRRPIVLKNNLGIVTFIGGRIEYYSLPPRRDLALLAGWALAPPAILLGLLRLWSMIATRRRRPT